jgi:Protein of unknown function (DUF1573)
MNRTLRSSLCVVPLILAAPGVLPAQEVVQQVVPQAVGDPSDWAKPMFDSTNHDFGVVARGAEVTHKFRIKNLYKQDIQVTNVTTSCGCTNPNFNRAPAKSGEETYVEISMDTNKFQHLKTSTVTVTVTAFTTPPQVAEVRIPVQVYIRSDVVFSPPSINFGAVGVGEKMDRSIEIAYAGRPDWKITKVVTGDPNVQAKIVETGRDPGGSVNYRLEVSLLPSAPVGLLRKQMKLITDDATGNEIPVLAQARVEGDITVTPSVVQLGTLAPGAEATKTVLLRGHKPFVIEKVECDSNRQAFRMPALGRDSKSVHVLSLAFTAPNQIGQFTEKFIVTIAGRQEPVSFTAQGDIQASSTQALNAVPASVIPQGQ